MLKWFHVIIVLIKCDSRKLFLIVRCNEWGEHQLVGYLEEIGVAIPT